MDPGPICVRPGLLPAISPAAYEGRSWPSGYFTDPQRECTCSPPQIDRYRARISGPLLDRIDLHIDVPSLRYRELAVETQGELSETVRARVKQARALQTEPFKRTKNFR